MEAQGLQNEDGSEWEGSLDQLFQDGAGTTGARIDYSTCVASVASSRQGHSLHKALTKLQQAISKMSESGAEQKGEKQISMDTKNMTKCARKLSEKLKIEPAIDD